MIRKAIALLLAVASGLYLLLMGPMADPAPIIDEALALVVLVQALAALGLDVRRWLPLFGKKVPPAAQPKPAERTIDV